MLPTPEELADIKDLNAVNAWVGVSPELWTATAKVLGAPTLVRHIAVVPAQAYAAALGPDGSKIQMPAERPTGEEAAGEAGAAAGTRAINVIELGMVWTVWAVCRLRMGMPAMEPHPAHTGENRGQASTAMSVDAGGSSQHPERGGVITERRIPINLVLDQDDSTELRPGDAVDLGRRHEQWRVKVNDGVPVDPDIEATPDQLTALEFRLKSGANPYADFGVWRSHHHRMLPVLHFTIQVRNADGSYKPMKVRGPSDWTTWKACWATYAFGMELLGGFSRKTANAYYQNIKALAHGYPAYWWIVGLADMKWRTIGAVAVRRELVAKHDEAVQQAQFSGFDPNNPWDAVFAAGASDTEYWRRWVTEQVNHFANQVLSPQSIIDEAVGRVGEVKVVDFDRFEGIDGPDAAASRRGRSRSRGRKDRSGRSAAASPSRDRSDHKKAKKKQKSKGQTPQGKGGDKGKKDGWQNGRRFTDGRFRTDHKGNQICWKWNMKSNECVPGKCPDGRAHCCEWCRSTSHRSGDPECKANNRPKGWEPSK